MSIEQKTPGRTPSRGPNRPSQSGTVLIVVLVVSMALAATGIIFVGRVLYERKLSGVQEDSSRALFEAFGELAKAEALVNASAYDLDGGRNLAIEAALEAADDKIPGTNVTVEPVTGEEGTYFALTARAEVGKVTRIVRALMSEKESFANYNFFVNSHPMGISGRSTPRGSIHTNRALSFYFADGVFVDAVTASEGFEYVAGATEENTSLLGPADPGAQSVGELTGLDFAGLRSQADIFADDDPDHDTKILLDGTQAHVETWTRGHNVTEDVYTPRQIIIDTQIEVVTDEVVHYTTETYQVIVEDFETQQETYIESVPQWDTQLVEHTRWDPIYDTRMVTMSEEVPILEEQVVMRTRDEQVWVEDDPADAGGGAIVGGGEGTPGHWETITVEYESTEMVQVGTETNTWEEEETYVADWVEVPYTTEEWYIREYIDEERTRPIQVKIGEHEEDRTREIVDYIEYVDRDVEVHTYDTILELTGTQQVWVPPALVETQTLAIDAGIIYVAGDVISLKGVLDGRLTLVSHGDVNITGNVQYIDEQGDTAYLNGQNPDLPYEPNLDYAGESVLGVVAKDDILYTSSVPDNFELNGSFLSQSGRVGITGITLEENGDANLAWPRYVKSSIRRLGGVISDKRPVTTYIDSNYDVRAGFRRGSSIYDRRLTYRPPMGFPERRRPVKIAVISRETVN